MRQQGSRRMTGPVVLSLIFHAALLILLLRWEPNSEPIKHLEEPEIIEATLMDSEVFEKKTEIVPVDPEITPNKESPASDLNPQVEQAVNEAAANSPMDEVPVPLVPEAPEQRPEQMAQKPQETPMEMEDAAKNERQADDLSRKNAEQLENEKHKELSEREAKARSKKEAKLRSEAEAKARSEKEAKLRAEAEIKARMEAEAKAKAEEAARKEALAASIAREEALKQAQIKAAAEKTAQAWVSRYFRPKVEQVWLKPPSAQTGMSCKIQVRLQSDGRVSTVDAVCTGGDAAFERSAEAAVRKAAPFPMPPDAVVAQQLVGQVVSFRFNPE